MRHTFLVAALGLLLAGCQSSTGGGTDHSKHLTTLPNEIKWSEGPSGLPPGAKLVVLEGNPKMPGFFTMRAVLPANYRIPPHWHPQPERLTILSGTLYLGEGDYFKEADAKPLPAGSYTSMPAGMHHFAYTKEETTIQLSSTGPWDIVYINPADDPRKSK